MDAFENIWPYVLGINYKINPQSANPTYKHTQTVRRQKAVGGGVVEHAYL